VPETARELLESLVGDEIETVTGRTNRVLAVQGDDVIVSTSRSPAGQPVPLAWVDAALDRLHDGEEVEVSVPSLGYRSAFVGAVLLAVPGATLVGSAPPRVQLSVDAAEGYRLTESGPINRWWDGDATQRYWLEVTDRPDIGVDLHCPQRDSVGSRTPGYSLIWWVNVDDRVLHYDRNERAIVAWSRVAGPVVEAPTEWLSHRGETRRRLQVPRVVPGWWRDLEGTFPFAQPVTLEQLRGRADDVRSVLDALKQRHDGALYFPFTFWRGSELRPMQPYLNKLPAELVELFPQLADATALRSEASVSESEHELGVTYREARANYLSLEREPFSVDPTLVERGLKGHADTQNELARVLREAGIEPRSRHPNEPNFDLAWEAHGGTFVAEVKSITDSNEEGQLRLGLGQVLRNRQRLIALGHDNVVAVLVPERTPRDRSWRELCDEVDVVLLSGDELGRAPLLGSSTREGL
jgi:hypothetical protein